MVTFLAGAAYLVGLARLRSRGDVWPRGRAVAAVAGLLVPAVAVLPPVGSHDEDFPVHVVQHLLLGMLAPLLLTLAAPITLALRVAGPAGRSRLRRLLHGRVVRLVSTPPAVLVLDIGGLYALYLTPLYALSTRSTTVHVVVHAHVVLSGVLLSWLLVGVDPGPQRPSTLGRLAVLVLAASAHAILAKLLYAQGLPAGAAGDRALGAELLYYGGDAMEVLLAATLMAQWYRRAGRAAARAARRHRVLAAPVPRSYGEHR